MKWLLSLPSFQIREPGLEDIRKLTQDRPGKGQKVLPSHLKHWPLHSTTHSWAWDEWRENTHLIAMHVAVLGMN